MRSPIDKIALCGMVVLFIFPYYYLFKYVGMFPAEDISGSLAGSYFRKAFCAEVALPRADADSPPTMDVDRVVNKIPQNIIDGSESIYFSEIRDQIVAIDVISAIDRGQLWALEMQGNFSGMELESFLRDASMYFRPCNVPSIDRGVTEGYWATKGTSVLHHWAHLYEASVSGGSTHAQYGFLVSVGSRQILEWASELGPTNFVRASWFIFLICGLLYIVIFLWIFRHVERLASFALLLKIYLFCQLGPFALLLAPGYHWFRELTIVAVAAIIESIWRSYKESESKRVLPGFCVATVFLPVCFLLSPVFFYIAITCAFLALISICYPELSRFIKSRRILIAGPIIGLSLIAFIVVVKPSSTFQYVFDKLLIGDHGLFNSDKIYILTTVLICMSACLLIILRQGEKDRFIDSYFAFVALFSSLYYFITPDPHHFLKFIEYSIPFGLVLIIYFLEQFEFVIAGRSFEFKRFVSFGLAGGYFVIATLAVFFIVLPPKEWQLRIADSFGEPYFKSQRYSINDRMIDANISDVLADHFRAFPSYVRADFIISPYDKYLLFLYDKKNGFKSPDFVPWLDSRDRANQTFKLITEGDIANDVLIDVRVFDVEASSGIKASHPILQGSDGASKLNLKARLRASELASLLMLHCRVLKDVSVQDWVHLKCGASE